MSSLLYLTSEHTAKAFSKLCRKQIHQPIPGARGLNSSMFPLHHGSTTKGRLCNVNHLMLFYKPKSNANIWNCGEELKVEICRPEGATILCGFFFLNPTPGNVFLNHKHWVLTCFQSGQVTLETESTTSRIKLKNRKEEEGLLEVFFFFFHWSVYSGSITDLQSYFFLFLSPSDVVSDRERRPQLLVISSLQPWVVSSIINTT